MEPILQQRIAPAIWRIRFRRTTLALTLTWSLAAAVAITLYLLNQNGQLDPAPWRPYLFWGTAALTMFNVLISWAWPVSQLGLIQEIEARYPELDSTLLTAVEQTAAEGQTLGFLQMDVLRKAVSHSYENNWAKIIPGWQLFTFPIAGLIGLFAFFAAMVGLMLNPKPLPQDMTIAFADAAVDPARFVIEVEPGNTEVEQGSSVLVMARFPDAVPTEATLVYSRPDGQQIRRTMSKSLDDPLFGARIAAIDDTTQYFIEYGGTSSEPFRINVFRFPDLVQADARLEYPQYTEMKPRTIQDVRRISAVEGTQVSLEFFVNKTLESATLQALTEKQDLTTDAASSISLVRDSTDPRKFVATIQLEETVRYKLNLVDEQQRSNRVPPTFVLNAINNRPPKLKLVQPGGDMEASPLEEVRLAAEGWDDFGIKKMGLSYSVSGSEPVELELDPIQVKPKTFQVEHLLMLESLGIQSDELVTLHFWAEDIDRDGQPRRVASDIFFAEIRPLEQIFRQAAVQPNQQQPSPQQQQQSGQNAQQAEQLADLQKQIIAGTWNVRRRTAKAKSNPSFVQDVSTLVESQGTALGQLEALAQKVQDPRSQGVVTGIRTSMNESMTQLDLGRTEPSVDPLDSALQAQQQAYAGLLKLRAREMEVSKQQQSQSQSQQSQRQNNRAQDQLNELELDADRNRYEQEKTATPQDQSPEAEADRQILNRLKDLARRQEDLNDRIKDLVTALEQAETPEEKEELERQLKSLREQQEKLLRDADELLEQMNEADNQERMSEQAEKLAETRENLRQTAESLQQREVAQAAAEGTRAQRELEELRDEFKERAAGQFTEQMREMRNRAQEIEQQQERIADQIQRENPDALLPEPAADSAQPRSLRDDEQEKLDLDKALAEQQSAVEDLRRRMRETIEEAEDVEPLLAESLYETYRETEANRPDRALEGTRRSLARGWMQDAVEQQGQARDGIEQMREGIERAAEQVLGDPTEALKAAEAALDDLTDNLKSEVEDATEKTGREPDDPSNQNESTDESAGQRSSKTDSPNANANDDEAAERQNENRSENRSPSSEQGSPETSGQRPNKGDSSPANRQGSNEGQSKSEDRQPGNDQQQPNDNAGQGDRESSTPGQSGESRDRDETREKQSQLIDQLGSQPSDRTDSPEGGGGSRTLNAGNQRMMRPMSGDDFREFYDQLKDVEEMLDDPDLRAQASRIRQQARELRKDQKERHSAEPNWDLVQLKVLKPMQELQNKVAEEILRRTSRDALVPINREPVPVEYQDAVKRYYERLGAGR